MTTNYAMSGLTEKTAPVGTDYIVVLDSEDTTTPPAGPSGSNKKVKLSNLPSSGGVSGWKNFISDYGADNTGVTACDTAIASAITAAAAVAPASFGLIVPPGKYTVATNHDLPYNMIMAGAGAVGGDVTGQFTGSIFNVSASFSGTTVTSMSASYVFGFKDGNLISGKTGTNGARVSGIFVDGSAFTSSAVAGFYILGPTMCTFSDIRLAQLSGWAIYTDRDTGTSSGEQFSFGQTWENVQANSCGVVSGGGFRLSGCEDSTFQRCYSIGNNNGPGFYINACDNTKFIACNSEWNSTYGFYVTGDWQFFLGGCTFTSCSTDANGQYGFYIDATHSASTSTYGTGPGIIHMTGCHFRRDGQTSGSTTAGFALGATTLPIIATGLSTIPSIGDSGGTTVRPAYGFYCSQTASTGYPQPIIIASSLMWGNTAAYLNNASTTTVPSFTVGSWANVALAHGPSQNPTYGS